jgi:uncharacterized protein (TIGR04255 family)
MLTHETNHEGQIRHCMPVELTADLGPLEEAPLQLALVQVRTPPVFAVDRPDAVEGLASGLPEHWVLVDQGRAQRVEVHLTPAGVAQSDEESERVWRFETLDQRYVGTLTPTSVSVETRRYEQFDEFHARVQELLGALAGNDAFAPRMVNRLGVRYVNELRDDRLGVDATRAEIVNPELLGPAASLGTGLVASLQELRFQQEDGVLAIRHGLNGPGQYLLDTDHYAEARRPFDTAELGDTVRRWHDTIEGVFAWAFQPWLRSRGVEP